MPPKKGAQQPPVEEAPPVDEGIIGPTVNFTIDIQMVIDKAVENLPYVRFAFLKDKVQTEVVGTWETVKEATEEDSSVTVGFHKVMEGVKITEKMLTDFNANPVVVLFFGYSAVGEEPEQAYAAWLQADVSGLMEGEPHVQYVFCRENPTAGEFIAPHLPPGIHQCSFACKASAALMNEQLKEALNPLSITLHEVMGLPGITVPDGDPRLKEYLKPTPHHILAQHCEPIYACFRLFDSGGAGDSLRNLDEKPGGGDASNKPISTRVGTWSRLVRTAAVPHGPSAVWNHRTVFLVGLLDLELIREAINLTSVTIEVHDRDKKRSMAEWRPAIQKWQALLAPKDTAPPPTSARGKKSPRPSTQEGKKQEEGAAAKEPMSVFDVDRLAADEASDEAPCAACMTLPSSL